MIAVDWNRNPAMMEFDISFTMRWKLARGTKSSVVFWYRRISFRASAPGLNLFLFLMVPPWSAAVSPLLLTMVFRVGAPDERVTRLAGGRREGAPAVVFLAMVLAPLFRVFLAVCLYLALQNENGRGRLVGIFCENQDRDRDRQFLKVDQKIEIVFFLRPFQRIVRHRYDLPQLLYWN